MSKAANVVDDGPKSFARRDHLRAMESRVQERWDQLKLWEVESDQSKEKFIVTFPYPYMNGRLHLGHAFSLTKAEFTVRFQRLQGKNVLFPFGFHCTGMPIQAAANKLRDEMEQYGIPPVFPEKTAEAVEAAAAEAKEVGKSAEQAIADKSKGKKSKLNQKGLAGQVRQWEILAKMVPEEEIPEFSDPMKWLNYFPPLGVQDVKRFGCAVDWRRSFITTAVSPVYDAFIRWQFNRLKDGNRIRSGFRPNIYSVKDGQVCADHDRASGESVVPQEYTLIKLLVVTPYPAACPLNHPELAGKSVFLVPATLRPETMYGQTNCYLLPEGTYGAYEFKEGEVLVMSQRAAVGLAHQDYATEWGKVKCIASFTGQQLMGLPLKAPNAAYEVVYTLPLLSISMGKGTGVVTSVPSDAPDDYVALKELKDKPLWREKFGLTAEMVEPFEVVPIIEIAGYGDKCAVTMCERLDIKSPNEAAKLKAAKDEVYLKGFYEGIMLVGDFKGMKVCDAKPLVRKQLIDAGVAIPYFEPESTVIGRSGDECIVALTDQWYLSYGDEPWQKQVSDHLHSDQFNGYNKSVMEAFDKAVDWLKEWACSRQFGLGTQLPWDPKWVIDSLSDSTIYMALYTVAHHFFGGVDNLSGTAAASPSGITADQLTDEIFDFIFLAKPLPEGYTTDISAELLQRIKGDFEYWYPMDLRVSAKDLIPNHLTMALYNHTEIWKDRPEMWPRGMYCNGHIMVDAEKMSKSKGNFLMMLECCDDFTADATRLACANAGDTLEDANFGRDVANQAISDLFVEEEWIRSVLAEADNAQLRRCSEAEMTFMDRAFNNAMDFLIEETFNQFSNMCFRDGLKHCWFDMRNERDMYRDWAARCGVAMHETVVRRFIDALAVMMSPICPHWSDSVWEIAGHTIPASTSSTSSSSASVCCATWPAFSPCDRSLRKEYIFFLDFLKNIRLAVIKLKVPAPRGAYIYLVSTYEESKVQVLNYMHSVVDTATGLLPATFTADLKEFLAANPELKSNTKLLMQFGMYVAKDATVRGMDALAVVLPFNQQAILEENSAYIKAALDLTELHFHNVESGEVPGEKKKAEAAVPGKPSYSFYAIK